MDVLVADDQGNVSVSRYLNVSQAASKQPLPPEAELQWWYQFFFATDRGRAGHRKYTHQCAKPIWKLASPKWSFGDATFDRSADAFANADHVEITIHNYRWRQGLATGEARFDDIEKRLATAPTIGVPTITMEGDANGAPHPEPSAYSVKFTGRYERRNLTGGIGHNLPNSKSCGCRFSRLCYRSLSRMVARLRAAVPSLSI